MDRDGGKDSQDRKQRSNDQKRCRREPGEKEAAVADAGFDDAENAILEIARCFWQTFAVPASQSWFRALGVSGRYTNFEDGCEFGLCVLSAVQAMRRSRSSCFHFHNPTCPGCAAILTEHERHFMQVFRAVRDHRITEARTHAIILCEGNDTTALLERMSDVVHVAYSDKARSEPKAHFSDDPVSR